MISHKTHKAGTIIREKVMVGRTWNMTEKRSIFARCVTINPSLVDEAWSGLDRNTRAIEYAELPSKLHDGFIRAIGQSARLKQSVKS